MNKSEELANQLRNLEKTLASSVNNLSDTQAQQRSAEGSWSVIDCVEHLYLVEKGIVRLLTKPQEETVSGDEQVFGQERMYKAMLNRERKITAPDPFVPKGKFTSLDEAKTALSELRETLIQALENNQIPFDGFTFPHPALGPLTRLDWVNFVVSHAQRHQAQLEEILEKTKSASTAASE